MSRKELTWDDLLARMRLLLSPLVAAGWTLSDEFTVGEASEVGPGL